MVESDSIHRVQETHVAIYHILWDLVHTLLADDRGATSAARLERGHEICRRIPRPGEGASRCSGKFAYSSAQITGLPRARCRSWKSAAAIRTRSSVRSRTDAADEVEFVHGPGCPVCVLPMGRVDDCVALAERPEVIFTTFGDAMRVPGSRKSLLQAKADGADVRMVYSPLDALADRAQEPGSGGGLFRPRLRDDNAEHGPDGDCRREREGITQFLAVLQSHHDHSDDQGDSRLARAAHWTAFSGRGMSAW